MKKTGLFLAIGLFFGAFAIVDVTAQQQTSTSTDQTVVNKGNVENVQRPFYKDNNGDGVCDNYATNRERRGRGQGQGKCRGQRNGQGNGFVDANKDGVCDNYTTNQRPQRKRLRNGSCNRQSKE